MAAPALPPPEVRPPALEATLDAPRTKGPWTLHVSNTGPLPVRLFADDRLVSLDLTPRSAARPLHCELPSDMLPTDSYERMVVVPPQRAWVITLDPELYCFSQQTIDALAAGTIVVAHVRWPSAEHLVKGALAVELLDTLPVSLPDEVIAQGRREPAPDDAAGESHLSLTGPARVDAPDPTVVDIPLTLRNEGDRPVHVRFRPEMMRVEVRRGGSMTMCGWPTLPGAPSRESFTTLAPSESAELTIMLSAYCPRSTLLTSGLLDATVVLDEMGSDGASVDLRAFGGRVIQNARTRIRLRHGLAPDPLVYPILW